MHPFRRPIAWLQAHPFAADVLLAVVVTAITLPSLWSTPTGEADTNFRDPDVLGVLLLVLSSAPIAWRRQSPFPPWWSSAPRPLPTRRSGTRRSSAPSAC